MTKTRKVQDMASEYRFDYKKAKPNRFANKMNLNVNWTVEKFVSERKEESGKKSAKAPAKTKSPKGKPVVKKKPVPKKTSAKPKKTTAKKKKK